MYEYIYSKYLLVRCGDTECEEERQHNTPASQSNSIDSDTIAHHL